MDSATYFSDHYFDVTVNVLPGLEEESKEHFRSKRFGSELKPSGKQNSLAINEKSKGREFQ